MLIKLQGFQIIRPFVVNIANDSQGHRFSTGRSLLPRQIQRLESPIDRLIQLPPLKVDQGQLSHGRRRARPIPIAPINSQGLFPGGLRFRQLTLAKQAHPLLQQAITLRRVLLLLNQNRRPRLGQRAAVANHPRHFGPIDVGSVQLGPGQIRLIQVSPKQNRPREVGIGQIGPV